MTMKMNAKRIKRIIPPKPVTDDEYVNMLLEGKE